MPIRRLLLTTLLAVCAISTALIAQSSSPSPSTPRVELTPAPPLRLGTADSNSPAIWQRSGGDQMLHVMTSVAGLPSTSEGRSLRRLGGADPIDLVPWPGGGVWMEAVVVDVDGTWYGYYHNENVATICGETTKVLPRIGAARSRDRGLTWQPIGIVLEAPPNSYDCESANTYFVGGVGDFSVQLDPASRDLYIFFSMYLRSRRLQGVGVARLAWADRDAPEGKAMVWRTGTWFPATRRVVAGQVRYVYPAAIPIFPAQDSWHDNDAVVDAFWGPSVHWNTYLEQYVMLLNRAKDDGFGQEGIYVSFAPRVDDPTLWSKPSKILDGGIWYPQVIGIEDGSGTDKLAGRWARFFMGGLSEHLIQFIK